MEKNIHHKRLVFLVSLLLMSIVLSPMITAQQLDDKFKLTIIIDGEGSVTTEPDMEGWYPNNTVVVLTANPAAEWQFDSWSGDLTGEENPATIIMDRNRTITAHFYKYEDTIPPTVEITKPINALYIFDSEFMAFDSPFIVQMITIQANATDTETGVEKVEFYINDTLRGTDSSAPYEFLWTETICGKYTIKTVAYDNAGNSASTELSVFKWRLHPIFVVPIFISLFILAYIYTHQ